MDFAPTDFCLFGPVKNAICGQKFRAHDEVIEEVKMWFWQTPEYFYQQGIKAIDSRWWKATEKYGDYVEQ
jgi:hypothetical protein